MDDHLSEQAEWRCHYRYADYPGAIPGVEQVLPISDALRSQIGVLTVMLGFGLWHVVVGMVKAEKH